MTGFSFEEERGTYTRTRRHPHNGYYAGDFSAGARPAGASPFTAGTVNRTAAHPADGLR